jgi:NRAMP (natural resistance-associated macrophage protein)-like metal ion transporter
MAAVTATEDASSHPGKDTLSTQTSADRTSPGDVESSGRISSPHQRGPWSYVKGLGPGLVTGASDDDPSGIATYSQAGASFQYGLLWTVLLSLPLAATVQEICDRTASSTGQNLGELTKRRFDRWGRRSVGVLLAALLIANALNITADVLAIGAGMHLLDAGPMSLWAAIAGVAVTVLVMTGSFRMIASIFKVLCVALLAYVVVLFFADVRWRTVVLQTVDPHVTLSRDYLGLFVAVLGTTISPYLFFWQSAQRVEQLADADEGGERAVTLGERTRRGAKNEQRHTRFDVISGIVFSNLVMFSIIVATGATIGAHGTTQIDSAAQAATALRPAAGEAATTLFALGFIGSGMIAVPVLAGSAASGLAGLAGRDWGFSKGVRQAPAFYLLVAIGTIGGTAFALIGLNPITLLVIVAAINGIAAAPFLVVVMLISGDHAIMGDHVNGRVSGTLGWAAVVVMGIAALALIAPCL